VEGSWPLPQIIISKPSDKSYFFVRLVRSPEKKKLVPIGEFFVIENKVIIGRVEDYDMAFVLSHEVNHWAQFYGCDNPAEIYNQISNLMGTENWTKLCQTLEKHANHGLESPYEMIDGRIDLEKINILEFGE